MKKWLRILLTMTAVFAFSAEALAQGKRKSVRKVQEVDFGEMSLKGTVRSPDGAYLVQKRGIRFLPLLDVQRDLDAKIREASQYVR